MSSTSRDSRQTTTQRPDPPSEADATEHPHHHSLVGEIRDEITEFPHEVAGVATHALDEIEDSAIGRWAVGAYVWLLDKAPSSTRGRLLLTAFIFVIVLIPSGALLYFTWGAEDSTETWFGDLGYLGVFLANMASTGTLFIPVPGLTAAAQALIVSSAASLNPIAVGVLGGLGMALGEVTAYVAGMAAAVIVREEEIKAPSRFQPLIDKIGRGITWLMTRYGALTIFTLSAVPNPVFELVGWSAGATRYSFLRFMAAVATGSVLRGLMLAYLGERVIFG